MGISVINPTVNAPTLIDREDWHNGPIVVLTGVIKALDALSNPAGKVARFTGAETAELLTVTDAAASLMALGSLSEILAAMGGATQSDIDAAVTAIINASPATLDTLNELAAALGDDPNFAATMAAALAAKADADDVGDALALKADIAALHAVALSGDYGALANKPTLGTLAALSSITLSLISDASANGRSLIAADYAGMKTLLGLHAVATSGSYNDLTDKPTTTDVRTGTVRPTLHTAADVGWILLDDGTIGNAASGATTRANADTADLFALLWANTANSECAVSGGRGASAAADFAAGKTIALPKAKGRGLGVYGTGSGLTARALAKSVGEETHTPTLAEMYAHSHSTPADDGATIGANAWASRSGYSSATAPITSSAAGSSTPFNVMSPITFLNAEVKL